MSSGIRYDFSFPPKAPNTSNSLQTNQQNSIGLSTQHKQATLMNTVQQIRSHINVPNGLCKLDNNTASNLMNAVFHHGENTPRDANCSFSKLFSFNFFVVLNSITKKTLKHLMN